MPPTNPKGNGAAPVEEMAALDSEVRHLGQRAAEDRIDVRARFDKIDAGIADLKKQDADLKEVAISGRTLARVALFLVPIAFALLSAFGPWVAERAVEQVLIRHGIIRSVAAR